MVISTLSVITNVCVLVLHHKNVKIQEPMPAWVEKYICGFLAKMLWMEQPDDGDDDDEGNEDDEELFKQPLSITNSEVSFNTKTQYSKGILTNNR